MSIKNPLPKSLQRLRERLFAFFAGRTGHGILPHYTPRRGGDMLPENLYHHCNDLPLHIFIDCICDHKYNGLVRHGNASPRDISRAWDRIYGEYIDKTGSPSSRALLAMSRDVAWHESKLRSVTICLKVLSHHYDERCVKVLRDYGYNMTFDINNPKEYGESLKTLTQRLSSVIFMVQYKSEEYKKESSKISGKPVTRTDFEDLVAILSKHINTRIDPKTVTVSEFAAYRRIYDKEIEAINKMNQKETAAVKNVKFSNLRKRGS